MRAESPSLRLLKSCYRTSRACSTASATPRASHDLPTCPLLQHTTQCRHFNRCWRFPLSPSFIVCVCVCDSLRSSLVIYTTRMPLYASLLLSTCRVSLVAFTSPFPVTASIWLLALLPALPLRSDRPAQPSARSQPLHWLLAVCLAVNHCLSQAHFVIFINHHDRRAEKRFTETHEWVSVEGKVATIGITNYAQVRTY